MVCSLLSCLVSISRYVVLIVIVESESLALSFLIAVVPWCMSEYIYVVPACVCFRVLYHDLLLVYRLRMSCFSLFCCGCYLPYGLSFLTGSLS